MSSPDRQLILSPQAEVDLADVLQYTLDTWGESQMLVYSKLLDDGLRIILDNPLIGFTRPAVSEQHRFFPAGEHLIAYRVSATRVEVSRILHSRMDLKRNL
jgi:toxin ParE1/3/4